MWLPHSHSHAQQVVECRPVHGGVGDPLDQRGSVHDEVVNSLCYVDLWLNFTLFSLYQVTDLEVQILQSER